MINFVLFLMILGCPNLIQTFVLEGTPSTHCQAYAYIYVHICVHAQMHSYMRGFDNPSQSFHHETFMMKLLSRHDFVMSAIESSCVLLAIEPDFLGCLAADAA